MVLLTTELALKLHAPRLVPVVEAVRLPKRSTHEDRTFLYIIQSQDSVKVGHAGNLNTRYSNLRVDNPHSVSLVAYYDLPKIAAKLIERLAHFVLREHFHAGEWFKVTPTYAQSVVERLIAAAEDGPAEMHRFP